MWARPDLLRRPVLVGHLAVHSGASARRGAARRQEALPAAGDGRTVEGGGVPQVHVQQRLRVWGRAVVQKQRGAFRLLGLGQLQQRASVATAVG